MNHIAVFDIGKTNKKLFVFDEDYQIVFEKTAILLETIDDDGDPCEDLHLLKDWVLRMLHSGFTGDDTILIKAVNCTAYGASFVHLDKNFELIAPLYNYLKPIPDDLLKQFFDTYGGEEKIALETSSPKLGMLNSGLQLYWLKYRKPLIFNEIKWSLHLPQFIAFLIGSYTGPFDFDKMADNTNFLADEITSVGCHTMLWDFQKRLYHKWVHEEGVVEKIPNIKLYNSIFSHPRFPDYKTGIGLHDSSAALIPYLATFKEPFVLISTGTWCISLNPFNEEPLTSNELSQDCLCYFTHKGKPVKAARYFGGNEHEEVVRNIASNYGVSFDFYKKIDSLNDGGQMMDFQNALDEYVKFMQSMMEKQVVSTRLAIGRSRIQQIFVDGGFSKNKIFMTLLAKAFPTLEVYAATVAQASALGAAVAIHGEWNTKKLPKNLVEVKRYKSE